MPLIKSICVYCGSGFGDDSVFAENAAALGRAMAEQDIKLVYGGGNVGLMGTIAKTVIDHGGHVTGIIPDFLKAREKLLDAVQETITVPDMHTRKRLMFEKADAFVALPGGIGTLEELVEQMTWAQLGRHTKPILMLNTKGFWKPLLSLLAHMRNEGFIRPGLELSYLVAEQVEDVIPMLEASARRIGVVANEEMIEQRF
ncbi:TIGR00730 family Rossman fold protein [Microvirga puerhi]|uniref:Cytokinin riboside 5'-monophosphate phosphoribohydrolase n=1 Tax=Microvirga puerhi TaxID=2876078 RepID=A0ABS7VNH1_9HYPH|nr:TIGR00730 family Rossman fold protein [Microvirga puerhi]MBZ6076493.1 TIGR00730 family Rossman fold protein [Microvirga puerhi]